MAGAVSLGPIGQIGLGVTDLDAAVEFYRDKLGMSFLFRVPNLAFFQCGEVRLMLSLPEAPGPEHRASIIYFRVDDVQAAYAGLVEQGVPFVDEPHVIARLPDREVWMAFFRDPAENLLGIMSEPPIQSP